MEGAADLARMRSTLLERVQHVTALCRSYGDTLGQYAHLYEDRKEALGRFLRSGRVLPPEEAEAGAGEGGPEDPPRLRQFEAQIDSYEQLYEDVCGLEPVQVFDSWMRVDLRPFKASLLNIIKKWSLMFKQHLVDHVTNR